MEGSKMASAIHFRNVKIFDGSGSACFSGEVRVEGNRIAAVRRTGESAAAPEDRVVVIEGRGATLMPGLTEAHAHLSWPTSVERFVPGMSLPPEDLLLNTARNARVLLDHGFTSAYSGGAIGRTLEPALKAHIDSGSLPGPRLIPSSLEREPPSSGVAFHAGDAKRTAPGRRAG